MNLIPASTIQKRWMQALESLVVGRLSFTDPQGVTTLFQGRQEGPQADMRIDNWQVIKHAMLRGDIGLGEDYIAGQWHTTSIENLFALFMLNLDEMEHFAHGNWLSRLGFNIVNYILKRNSKRGSSHNIQAHYDVGNDFYRLWLDESMTYSSALYATGAESLAEAQRAKYQRILSKFKPMPGTILEIGCGWGGFAQEAHASGHQLTGLTISPAQHAIASQRTQGRAEIRLQDYRDVDGQFDYIVSIEMFEAVGERYWPNYFNAVYQRLKPGGKAVIQTITIDDQHFADYRTRSDFIRHYVFPGGMLPSLARFREEAEKAGLQWVQAFSFGQDYARTLREWLVKLEAKRPEILALGHNDAFIRNWRFYLAICAAAFAINRTDVVQVELIRPY